MTKTSTTWANCSITTNINTTTINVIKNKVYFNKSGNQFDITAKVNLNLSETLPVGTYSINFDECSGKFYLETMEDFHLKGKLYGDVVKSVSRILNTSLSWPRSTGVLLVGEKGSGKMLLAHSTRPLLLQRGRKSLPLVSTSRGKEMNSMHLFRALASQFSFFLDEFKKTYNSDDQKKDVDPI